jgi:predicted nucleic acid-binding protein
LKVLVDTCVWSRALRWKGGEDDEVRLALRDLILDGLAEIIGPVRQELLSGIRHAEQFATLRNRLRAFVDLPLERNDYERAAEVYNLCRSQGIQGSNTDFLLCAVAERRDLPLFTTDADFVRFAEILPFRLFS